MINSILIIAGAWLYRYRGMTSEGWFKRPLPQMVFAFPYAIAAYMHFESHAWAIAFVVFALTALAVCTGHGGGMDLGKSDKERDDETLEFIIKWAHGKIPEYWYDVILLSVTGLAITLPVGIATLNPWLALSGAMKGPAYMAADNLNEGTEGGELLTGAALWGAIWLT